MLFSIHLEVVHGGIADHDRRVNERVIVGRAVAVIAACDGRQCRNGPFPVRRRVSLFLTLNLLLHRGMHFLHRAAHVLARFLERIEFFLLIGR